MTSKRNAAETVLEKLHAKYYADFQEEHPHQAFMADNGHPYAEQYRRLRERFDNLKYAAGTACRWLTYRSDGQGCRLGIPLLTVTDEPGDFGGFGHCCPVHEEHKQYLELAAEKGWPKELRPGLMGGGISIRTNDSRLVRDIADIKGLSSSLLAGLPTSGVRYRLPNIVSLGFTGGFEDTVAICGAVLSRQRYWVLPPRTDTDRLTDSVPLELVEYPIEAAMVPEVTIAHQKVLVPAQVASIDQAVQVCDEITELCRTYGYPWRAVRPYVSRLLNKSKIEELDEEFQAEG